ncbi:MAG: hypothetical protein II740_04125 [Lachnospiraceae bacterium]|nr:hypothetical protein [Lachnospiraceae bacterium]
MKSNLLNRWIINSIIVFALFFILVGIMGFKETMDYAKGNSYAAKHLMRSIVHGLFQSFGYSFIGTLTFGQLVFWVTELLRKLNVISFNTSGIGQFIVIPIITLVFSLLVIMFTAPLWFRIPF